MRDRDSLTLSYQQVLSVAANNITGVLPRAWSNLPTVRHVNVSHNLLGGGLPLEWSSISSLQDLDASGNVRLGGVLPLSWSALRSLRHLDLDMTVISGALPVTWSVLQQLSQLHVSLARPASSADEEERGLRGLLPDSWGDMRSLQLLSIRGHRWLGGQLPGAWAGMRSLEVLDLAGCGLSGVLPREYADLGGLVRVVLDSPLAYSNAGNSSASSPSLVGGLPPEWSRMARLTELSANGHTALGGVLPADWAGGMSALAVLSLASCGVGGPLPGAWAAMAQLAELDLGRNALTGPLPPAWSGLRSLRRLVVAGNRLVGVLPPEWADGMGSLAVLDGSDNRGLSGQLPSSYTALSTLEQLRLRNCSLSGESASDNVT